MSVSDLSLVTASLMHKFYHDRERGRVRCAYQQPWKKCPTRVTPCMHVFPLLPTIPLLTPPFVFSISFLALFLLSSPGLLIPSSSPLPTPLSSLLSLPTPSLLPPPLSLLPSSLLPSSLLPSSLPSLPPLPPSSHPLLTVYTSTCLDPSVTTCTWSP